MTDTSVAAPQPTPKQTSTDLSDISLGVEGMTCAACASRIARALNKLDGVDHAEVNLTTADASIRFDQRLVNLAALTERIEKLGYTVTERVDFEAARHDLGRRAALGLALAIPTMLLSMIPALHFSGWRWAVAAMATPVVAWIGWPFHRRAFAGARQRTFGMDALVSLGSGVALIWSLIVILGRFDEDLHLGAAALIVALVTLGKYLEARATGTARDAIADLADLSATIAELEDGTQIPADQLEVGSRFVVRSGTAVATDGVVVSGSGAVDTSMITGEPVPVAVVVGDDVVGASINQSGYFVVEATNVGADTTLAKIAKLVAQAQGAQAPIQRLVDRVAGIFVPVVLTVAAMTTAGWLLTGHDLAEAVRATVAVLVIACPCALGLATPMAIMVGTGRGAELGILIKGGEVLETAHSLDVVILDKTGTVTEGKMRVTDVLPASAVHDANLMATVATLESRSDHPIARAVVEHLQADGSPTTSVDSAPVSEFAERPGFGVLGTTADGGAFAVGRARLFESIPGELRNEAATAAATGMTVIFAGPAAQAQVAFVLADTIRPTSPAAIAYLDDLNLETILLTGDNQATAQRVADTVGIATVIAGVLPDQKDAEVARLQANGQTVAMIGDGINDAPALARANLGVAMGTGTAVAQQAADLTLVSADLLAAVDALRLSRRTFSTIRTNLFWAFAYNVAAIPLAVFGMLNPAIAAGAMVLSSLFVTTNSLRLRRFSSIRSAPAKDNS